MSSQAVHPLLNAVGGGVQQSQTLHIKNIKVPFVKDLHKETAHDSCSVGGKLTVEDKTIFYNHATFDQITGAPIDLFNAFNADTEAQLTVVGNKTTEYDTTIGKLVEEDPIPLQLCCLYRDEELGGENMCFLPGDYSGRSHLGHFGVSDHPHSIRCAPGVRATLYQNHNKDGGSLTCREGSSISNLRDHGNMHPSSMVVELVDKETLPTSGRRAKVPLRQYTCPSGYKVKCSANTSAGPADFNPEHSECKFGYHLSCEKTE